MAEFGWAYVAGGAITGAWGPTGSIMLKKEHLYISGSPNFIFDTSSNTLQVDGIISGSGNISGSSFYGSGANLTGITFDRVTDLGATTTNSIIVGGITSTGNVTITGSLTVSGSELVTGNLQVLGSISGPSPLHIIQGANITGSLRFSSSVSNPVSFIGLSAGTATTSSYLALDSSNNIILTSSAGGVGGQIGVAEDGDYTDGLFTDFATSTPVGTAVDRFNEIMKIISPSPAPSVQKIKADQANGVTVKLSFDGTDTIPNHNASSTAAGFSSVSRNGIYAPATSGNNIKLGVYNNQEITGLINYNIAESATNGNISYSSASFNNGDQGTLKLELNGVVVHTVSLSGLAGAGNPATGSANSLTNGSGFTNVSINASSIDGNGAEWNIFKHRTAKYKIEADDQHKGWNYIRVIHTVGSTDNTTNYIEWINDVEGSAVALAISNPRIENVSLVGSSYLSGIQYNTGFTAKYKALLDNIYRNIYPTGSVITFTETLVSNVSAQSIPNLEDGENYTKSMAITASLTSSGTIHPSHSPGLSMNVDHPIKTNLTNAGPATATGFLIIDPSPSTSTNLIEHFQSETYRVTSGSYTNQVSTTAGAATWNSQNHMTGSGAAGHTDGLVQLSTEQYQGHLYSPIDADLPNSGDITSLANGAAGNPDYSGISGTRTYYRRIQNTSGATKRDIKITSTKNATSYNNASLSTGNAHFFIKIPGTTGFMDISQNFSLGDISDGDGALISGASNDTDSGNNVHNLSFGTVGVANNEYVIVKIIADGSWAGYVSQLSFQFGASAENASDAPALDDIDINDTGTGAKLSFGSSNSVSGYTNNNGGSISLSTFNSNGNYTVSGDRRGVFSAAQAIDGELNEDVASTGNYIANAFNDAHSGSLILEVNGVELQTLNLVSSINSINSYNGNSSGMAVGAVAYSTTSDGVPNYTRPYRTGTYTIGTADQVVGWNYARVIHRIDGSDTNTNYVEWIIDTDSNALAASSVALSNFNHPTTYYQSGVKYFAVRPSGSFTYTAANVYRNIYSNSSTAVQFPTTTQCSITNIRISGTGISTSDTAASSVALPALDNSADCEQQNMAVTGTVLFDQSTSLVGNASYVSGVSGYTIRVDSSVDHPLKSNLSTSTLTKNNFLVFSASLGNTNEFTEEYFNLENYRIVSGNYTSQGSISSGAWNSQRSMNDVGSFPAYDDGLMTFNSFLISPLKGGDDGDFRNVADGGSLQSPASNVNYSTGVLNSATRTFYRYYENNTSNDRSSITITIYGSCTLVNKSTSIGSNDKIHLEAKIPGNTAWLDVGKAYTSNNKDVNGSGALVGGSSPTSIVSGGSSITCTFNGGSLPGTVSGEEKVILKISAHKDWSGYINRLTVAYS
jgi:hypothetical protein